MLIGGEGARWKTLAMGVTQYFSKGVDRNPLQRSIFSCSIINGKRVKYQIGLYGNSNIRKDMLPIGENECML